MLIAIVGTHCAGKSTVEDYFVSRQGFRSVRIISPNNAGPQSDSVEVLIPTSDSDLALSDPTLSTYDSNGSTHDDARLADFSTKILLSSDSRVVKTERSLCFSSAQDFLDYATKHWQHNLVTVDLRTRHLVEMFIRRPFLMVLNVDAPMYERFLRSKSKSLEEFVRDDDRVVFGMESSSSDSIITPSSLQDLTDVRVINSFHSISDLYAHLDSLNLLDPENLRPGWDAYFMTLASLASQRSNCMKRRVGAVLVRDNRVLSTGYNGTARGLSNCNQGGCRHCNGTTLSVGIPYECVCLHAEENALLEAGRERIGQNAVLYCNTCPCLRCTVKIIQTGVKTVVYNLTYKVDDASASLFTQAGVELRKYNPIKRIHLPVGHSSGFGLNDQVRF
ncbi:hypothetical protein L208DRAFT_1368539 [Tricholoma matsutake]|nr:hypothetical protein L208DRAFT_1368539 [Tricholoma matsutake 945]